MPSPGEDIQSWSTVAANNGTADPLIDWHEGQARASVNNSSRSEMAAHAKNRNLLNGSIVTTGSANAQQFLSGLTYTSIPANLVVRLKVGSGLTNTASATLNMDGLGDTLVKTTDGANLKGNEFVGDGYVDLLYNGTNWIFLYSREFFIDRITGGDGIVLGVQKFVSGSFTYTPTDQMKAAIVECFGAGGGGGAAWSTLANTMFQGGGGGGGGYSRKLFTLADVTAAGGTITGTVGAGGVAGTSGPGGNGGATNFGTLCTANGGGGGNWCNYDVDGQGGTGAAVGVGDIANAGTPGHNGWFSRTDFTSYTMSGNGAAGPLGGGAGSGTLAPGNAGNATGAGGSGGSAYNGGGLTAGGAGGGGMVIVTEFAGVGAAGRDGNDGAPGPTGPMGPAGPAGAGTGDVLRSGTPTAGQMAQWTDAAHIRGIDFPIPTPSCGRLTFVSATQIKFVPYNGDTIKINGTIISIPAAGFSMANGGGATVVDGVVGGSLVANTTYLVCAYDQGGGILGATFRSTLTHSASTTTGNVGVEIATGIDAFSVIGMVRTNASGQFQDSAAVRGVLSWFNRRPRIAQGKFTADRTTTSGTAVEIHSEIAVGFLVWGEASAVLATAGSSYNTAATGLGVTMIYLDGAQLEGGTMHQSDVANSVGSIGITVAYGGLNAVTEGYHTATLYGFTSTPTQYWTGSNSTNRCTLTAQIFG